MRVKLRSAQLTGKIFPFGPISIFFFHLPNEKLSGLKRQKGKKYISLKDGYAGASTTRWLVTAANTQNPYRETHSWVLMPF